MRVNGEEFERLGQLSNHDECLTTNEKERKRHLTGKRPGLGKDQVLSAKAMRIPQAEVGMQRNPLSPKKETAVLDHWLGAIMGGMASSQAQRKSSL